MISLITSKELELSRKLDSLAEELKLWCEESEEQKPLAKHHSQLLRITDELLAVLKRVRDEVAAVARQPPLPARPHPLLGRGRELQKMILELHHIWDYFRSKLALRYVPALRDYLAAADELAFACYEPVQKLLGQSPGAAKRVKDLPLVYLTSALSPFITPRHLEFTAALVAPGEAQQRAYFKDVLQRLPIPVLGVPWFQVAHLPESLVIAHEVGHLIEEDCELAGVLTATVDATVAPARQTAWRSWIGELFADLYACMALGPAYVGTLLGFLAQDPETVQRAVKPTQSGWGAYPTDALRIHFNVEVLRQRGFDGEAGELLKRWQDLYPQHAMTGYMADIAPLVAGLLDTGCPALGGAAIKTLISFTSNDHASAQSDAQAVLGSERAKRGDTASKQVRLRFISAALAFLSDPDQYQRRAQASLLKSVLELRGTSVRGGSAAARGAMLTDWLFATLSRAAAAPEAEPGQGTGLGSDTSPPPGPARQDS